MPRRTSSSEIRDFILNEAEFHPRDIARVTAKRFDISRQAVNQRIRGLVSQGWLSAKGNTRARCYEVVSTEVVSEEIRVSPGLEEDVVWRQLVVPAIHIERTTVRDICAYAFTEILNNVVDHSESDCVLIGVEENPGFVDMRIRDSGIGIFKKIKNALALHEEREAILELSKGKFTTDPEHHSGEGIFFTSRMVDYFSILSGGLCFAHRVDQDDWLLEVKPVPEPGTCVRMKVSKSSAVLAADVFDQYSSVEEPGFSRTHVPLCLAKYGHDTLVSRSQAKRILARFTRFSEVFLDFDGIDAIGQAFADEIFRVFRRQHPETNLVWVRANPRVKRMIERVTASAQTTEKNQ